MGNNSQKDLNDLPYMVAIHMDYENLITLCRTNKEFNRLCKSPQFWNSMVIDMNLQQLLVKYDARKIVRMQSMLKQHLGKGYTQLFGGSLFAYDFRGATDSDIKKNTITGDPYPTMTLGDILIENFTRPPSQLLLDMINIMFRENHVTSMTMREYYMAAVLVELECNNSVRSGSLLRPGRT